MYSSVSIDSDGLVVLQVAEAREELSFLESNPELFLRESLHRVAYSGALGNPLFPTKEALGRIHRGAIRSFFLVISFVRSSYPLYSVCNSVRVPRPGYVVTSIGKCQKPQLFFAYE
jgi:hypothetical protein